MPRPKKKSLDQLKAESVALLREYVTLDRSRTDVLRRLAEVALDFRSRFTTPEGPDWAGRSWEYRQAVTEVYREAGIPADAQESVQAAIRYHIGNLLRERLTSAELAAAGLLAASPRQRIAAHRAGLVAAEEALEASLPEGERHTRAASPAALLGAAERALDSLERRLKDLGPDDAAEVAVRLESLLARVESLLGATLLETAAAQPRRRRSPVRA